MLGSDGPAYPLAIAQGELGKFILASPHANLVVVSMGNTWGADASCPVDIRPGGAGISGAEEDSDREAFAEEAFRRAHVDPQERERSPRIPSPRTLAKTTATCRRRLSERSSRTPRELGPRSPSFPRGSRRGSPRWGEADESSLGEVANASQEPPPQRIGSAASEGGVQRRRGRGGDASRALERRGRRGDAAREPVDERRSEDDVAEMRGGVGAGPRGRGRRGRRRPRRPPPGRRRGLGRGGRRSRRSLRLCAPAAASASAGLEPVARAPTAAAARGEEERRPGASLDERVRPWVERRAGKRRRARAPTTASRFSESRASSSSSPGHHGSCRCSCPPRPRSASAWTCAACRRGPATTTSSSAPPRSRSPPVQLGAVLGARLLPSRRRPVRPSLRPSPFAPAVSAGSRACPPRTGWRRSCASP